MRKNIFFIIIICAAFKINAQDTLYLSLNKMFELVNHKNLIIKINNLGYNVKKAEFYQDLGKILPDFNAGIRQYSLEGYTQNAQGDFEDVIKNNQWTGASFQVNLDVSDAVFSAISSNKERKASFYKKEISNTDEKMRIYELYYNLAASREKEKAIAKFVQKNQQIVEQIQFQVDNGLTLESNLLLAKTNLNNLKIQSLAQTHESVILNQKLLSVLDIIGDRVIQIDCNYYDLNDYNINKINVNSTVNKRIELQQMDYEISSLNWQKREYLYGMLLPNISVGMNDGILGPINANSLGGQNIFTTSLMWNIPFNRLYPSGDFKKQRDLYKIKLLEKKQLENNLTRDINIIISAFKSSDKQYQLAKKSVEFSEKAYEHSFRREKLGTASQLELFYAEKEYLNAQLIYINAIRDRNNTGYKKILNLKEKLIK